MNVEEYLTLRGISLQEIVESAKAALRLADEDVLFLTGSLVEGIGNERSDLDLFLLTDRHNIEFNACLSDVAILVGRTLVDVRVLQRSTVEALIQRFERWSEAPRLPRRAFEFVLDERKFLHRLSIGRALTRPDLFSELQSRVSPRGLCQHNLDWARHLATSIQVDLRGLWQDGDSASMILAAVELLGHTADALLAAHGASNPNTKWRMRYLSRLQPTWVNKIPGRPPAASAVEWYLSLLRLPTKVTPSSVYTFAMRICAAARAVIPIAEKMLLSDEEISIPDFRSTRCHKEPGVSLPALDLDVEIRYAEHRFEIVRLNDGGVMFQLSNAAFAALCFFDGETTVEETGIPANMLNEMQALVRFARFEGDAPPDEELLQMTLRGEVAS